MKPCPNCQGTETNERRMCLGCGRPRRILHKSLFDMKNDESLFGLNFMEGGSYIHDWLHRLPGLSYESATIPEKVARLILDDIGLGERGDFGNKDFVCFTTEQDVTGHNDRPMKSFLYCHDFSWYIYTLR